MNEQTCVKLMKYKSLVSVFKKFFSIKSIKSICALLSIAFKFAYVASVCLVLMALLVNVFGLLLKSAKVNF